MSTTAAPDGPPAGGLYGSADPTEFIGPSRMRGAIEG